MRKLIGFIAASVLVLSAAGCAPGGAGGTAPAPTPAPAQDAGAADENVEETPAAAGGPIRIALAAPLTGGLSNFGEQFRQGVEFKAHEVNSAGGINGRMVEIVSFDDRNDPAEAASIAQMIAADETILGVVGHFSSSCIFAATPIYQDASVAMITPSASHPALTQDNDVIFRMWTSIGVYAPLLADLAVSEHGHMNIAMLTAQNDLGITIRDYFSARAVELGATIVADELFNDGDMDFRTQLTNIRGASPDALAIFGWFAEGIIIIQQARALGIDVQLYGTGTFYEEQFVEIAGADAEGMFAINEFVADDPRDSAREFIENFMVVFPDIVPGNYHGNAYDALAALLHAYQHSDGTRQGIVQALHNLAGFQGITGELTFADQEVIKPQLYIQMRDGQWRFVREAS